ELAQAVSLSDSVRRPIWRSSGFWEALALAVLATWLYVPILTHLVEQWWADPNFSHGFFVPAFSLFLLWQRRAQLREMEPQPSLWGLPIIAGSMCLLILGTFGAELFISRMSLLVLIAGLTIFFTGWEALRVVLFPLIFLVLMVPIPAIIFSQITF